MKRFKGHQAFVNTVSCARRGPQLICSGSDDGTVKVRTYPGQTFLWVWAAGQAQASKDCSM